MYPLCFWTDPNSKQDHSVQPRQFYLEKLLHQDTKNHHHALMLTEEHCITSRFSVFELIEKSVEGSDIGILRHEKQITEKILRYSIASFYFFLNSPEAVSTIQCRS
ncbi:hypothetical protein TNCV_2797001 [Trichonephila clavipes]|nr:hypothetical protein TNCV_2797001 [Trichonephila clavipes]